jgi:protein-disulfide isomerase
MINKRTLVLTTALVALIAFAGLAYLYTQSNGPRETVTASVGDGTTLVRPSSPVMGPADARVTIVEFFDPACESCRAFYPVVKQLMAEHPNAVRVVLRYAAFHEGSEEAVRILETARLQGKFQPVLEALLDAQPVWASHGSPNMARAWEAARKAGLDEEKARREMALPNIDAILRQDGADIMTLQVKKTPTFFVNGKPLSTFGRLQLEELVRSEAVASN